MELCSISSYSHAFISLVLPFVCRRILFHVLLAAERHWRGGKSSFSTVVIGNVDLHSGPPVASTWWFAAVMLIKMTRGYLSYPSDSIPIESGLSTVSFITNPPAHLLGLEKDMQQCPEQYFDSFATMYVWRRWCTVVQTISAACWLTFVAWYDIRGKMEWWNLSSPSISIWKYRTLKK